MKATMIVIDGLDGTGKETQSKALKAELERIGKKVLLLSFPVYESPIGTLINSIMAGETKITDPVAHHSVFALDRAITFNNARADITEYTEDPNAVIICDRYYSSSLVYDTIDLDDRELLKRVRGMIAYENSMGVPNPSFAVYLTLDKKYREKVLNERVSEGHTDVYESNRELQDKVGNNLERLVNIIDKDSSIEGSMVRALFHPYLIECSNERERFTPEEVTKKIIDLLIYNS